MTSFVKVSPFESFEGREKKLEVDFQRVDGDSKGLRVIPRSVWESMLALAKCSILSSLSNDEMDSYVLSESSLFVYPYKMVLKTCGRTTLLHTLPMLKEIARDIRSPVEYVAYSHRDLQFPGQQEAPHGDFKREVELLEKYYEGGHSYFLGPEDSDHYCLYVVECLPHKVVKPLELWDGVGNPSSPIPGMDQTLEIMMSDLPLNIMQQFLNVSGEQDASKVSTSSGISSILPSSEIDAFIFEPCGYSMNGLFGGAYWTIHVTPQPQCSYVSFETNLPCASFDWLIRHVLQVFCPGKVTVVLFSDAMSPAGAAEEVLLQSCRKGGSTYKCSECSIECAKNAYSIALVNMERTPGRMASR